MTSGETEKSFRVVVTAFQRPWGQAPFSFSYSGFPASSYPTLWVSRLLAMDLENLIFPLLSQSGARPSRSTSLHSELHSDAFP